MSPPRSRTAPGRAPVRAEFEIGAPGPANLQVAGTDPQHLAGVTDASDFPNNPNRYRVRSAGNAVTREDEMIKVVANKLD